MYDGGMRKTVQRTLDALARGRRFITHDVWHIGRPGEQLAYGFVVRQIRVAFLLVRGFVKDALLERAAALTFVTMLSMVPLLIILVFVVQALDLEQDLYSFVEHQVFRNVAQEEHPANLQAPTGQQEGSSGEKRRRPDEPSQVAHGEGQRGFQAEESENGRVSAWRDQRVRTDEQH